MDPELTFNDLRKQHRIATLARVSEELRLPDASKLESLADAAKRQLLLLLRRSFGTVMVDRMEIEELDEILAVMACSVGHLVDRERSNEASKSSTSGVHGVLGDLLEGPPQTDLVDAFFARRLAEGAAE